jgi:hypothetical protein
LRFLQFHGMEEVVGSIPTRSTNQPLNTVTALLPTTACNVPARCAFIQLDKVCSTTPRLPPADATLCPDSTSRAASRLSSSVYQPHFPFRIFASLCY